jgi:hypothetical protein
MEESRNHPISKARDCWEKWSISTDIIHKIVILIIGSFAAGIFYWYQQLQVESRYFADLMAQRESAETQLRAQMFKTLFDAYFANKLQTKFIPEEQSSSVSGDPGDAAPHSGITGRLEKLKQEAMFADLLSRNFESIDVRPLFEDLDAQLSVLLYPVNKSPSEEFSSDKELRNKAFSLRERLRRIAFGASSRQITALTGAAQATVTTHRIKSWTDKKGGKDKPLLVSPSTLPLIGDVIPFIDRLKDGTVTMRLVPKNEAGGGIEVEPVYLQITFFDMPSLENILLPNGDRVAFTLSNYMSYDSCKEFKEQFDEPLRSNCDDLLKSKEQDCDIAVIRIITFPKGYIGARDRPYLNDLIARKFARSNKK